jgi:hypothetical protein
LEFSDVILLVKKRNHDGECGAGRDGLWHVAGLERGSKLRWLVAIASKDFDLTQGLSGMDDLGDGEQFCACESGTDKRRWGASGRVIRHIESVFLSEQAGAV